ncbi:MAG: putative LPS assembly protein LptD [Bacteroidales bacterium]|nr:putative LPS assembly protein LptD [Bacteroidales bacterium]
MYLRIQSSFFGVAVLALFTCSLHAQDITETSPAFPQKADTSARRGLTPQNAEGYPFEVNSLDFLVGDSLEFVRDDSLNYTPGEALVSMSPDSVAMKNDSLAVKKTSSPFKTKITYNADSIVMSNSTRKAYLYKNAVLKYGDIQLKGDYMELDSDRKTVYSTGLPDSTGKMAGLPVFTQGEEEFETKSMTYNFKTRRGVIHEVITEQSGGYLHAGIAKRYDNGQIDIKKGKFTTCENEHPHFYLALTKAKVIPNSKTITGPAYVVLEDVPLPIGIPFGFIPTIKDNRQSGVLIPTWGEEATRGFNLTGGGYYFALSQHFDLKTTFDVYSKGTWGFEMASTYLQRYKFRGSFQSRFYKNVSGEPGLNQTKSTSYSLKWSHAMDSKAIPGQSFNISVDFSTNKFDQLHNYTNTTQLMTNTKRSSIAYSKNWTNKPFHFTPNANHSQSSGSDQMAIMFPSLNFTVDR